jgi:Zn-dependent M32 family carboxypeptidase
MSHDIALSSLVEKGDLTPVLGWLRSKIHSRGRELSTFDLVA